MLSMLPSFSRLERKKKEKELESLKKKKKKLCPDNYTIKEGNTCFY